MSAPGPLLAAIDIGTGSCRVAIFTTEGHQLAIAQREYTHRAEPGVAGSQVFDTGRVWDLIGHCAREALASAAKLIGRSDVADRVAAISATSMREGMVLWDAAGHELWACPNVDSRAGAQAAELVESGAARQIYELAGDWVAITAPARFRWLAAERPDVLAATTQVGMLGDWVLTRLSGVFATDPSLGSSSGMFDLAARTWSKKILDLCGLDCSLFPPVLSPGTVLGEVVADAAARTGFLAGTPVVVGGADTQLALVGVGVRQPGRLSVVGGSFWQTTLVVDRPLIDPQARLRTLCHSADDRWMVEGIGFYCGLVMRWFRDAFCELEIAEAAQRGVDPYAVLEEKASRLPPANSGLFGIFSDVMRASSWKHAAPAFVGFDVGDPIGSGRIACFKAIEEAAAYVACGHRDILLELRALATGELLLTGGAAKGSLWPQIVADVLGMSVHVPAVKESAALGAALYAGVGAGLWPDAARRGEEVSVVERTLESRQEVHLRYEELYRRWSQVYAHELELTESNLLAPLWRAAGA